MIDKIDADSNLEGIDVADVRAYVEAKGWRIEERYSDKALVYSHASSERPVLVPLKKTFADFALRISELISTLAELERKEKFQVIRDINLSSWDVLKIRLTDSVKAGSVPLDATRNFPDEARELFLSSASACINPKLVYGNKRAKEAEEYIRKVRLGQTEVGSYVFTILSPITPVYEETLPLPLEDVVVSTYQPFERKVTEMLRQALHSSYSNAVETVNGASLDHFSNLATSGVSANLCQAIANMTMSAGNLDFNISWAATRRPEHNSYRETVHFTPALADVLQSAADHFRATQPQFGMILQGYVVKLEKDKLDPAGNVLLKVMLDGKLKTVKAALNDAEYHSALKAHENFRTVTIEGDLYEQPRVRFLKNVRNFTLDQDRE